jgi:hypothetical protein
MDTQSYYIKCEVCLTDILYTGNEELLNKFIARGGQCRCKSKAQLKVTPGTLR